MPQRRKKNPIPQRNKVQPLSKPPTPQIPEQPVVSPEEEEAILAKAKGGVKGKKEKKDEDTKADMPKVWEYKRI